MNRKVILLVGMVVSVALVLAACSGVTNAPAPSNQPAASAQTQTAAPKSNSAAFEAKSNEGGSVTVKVTPLTLSNEQPLALNVVMDTHSVELSDDMTKIAILRDDNGNKFQSTAWEGAGPGGHHREGTLKFAALTGKPKFVELVIKGLAGVQERVFRWDVLS